MKPYQRGPDELLRFLWKYYPGLTAASFVLGAILFGSFVAVVIYLVGRM